MSQTMVLNVLISKPESKVSVKSGKPYSFLALAGVATMPDGTEEMFKFTFWPERDQPLPVWPKGFYTPVFGAKVNWETSKLEPTLLDLVPLKKSPV